MSTAPRKPSWALKKQVLVSLPHGDSPCLAKFYVDYDGETNQGTISLNFKAKLANSRGGPEQFSLNLPPSAVERYKFVQPTTETLFPESLLAKLPAPTSAISTVITLTLDLHEIGAVAGPPLIQPPNQVDSDFTALEKICKSSTLHIHFTQRQFQRDDLYRLKTFFFALKEGIRPKVFNHARQGRIERDGHVFGKMLDPPPYLEEPDSEQVEGKNPPSYSPQPEGVHVGGKRRRDHSSSLPKDDRRKRPVFTSPKPSCYSTEPNTPSIPSPLLASIQPTNFTRASSLNAKEHDILARIENMLQGASDDLKRHLLTRLGCRCPQAVPALLESNVSSKSDELGSTKVGRIDPAVQEYIDRAISDRFESDNVEVILGSLVREFHDKVFGSRVSEFHDEAYDAYRTHETEICELVEEKNSEVRITADECVKEVQEQAQRCIDEMEEQAQQCMDDIKARGEEAEMSVETSVETKVAELRRWFDMSPRVRFGGQSSPSHELRANVRRSSC
ncbi:uncharacterized protein BP01DRAFT_318436 [Aspergillus saccharolyticus JOP 1030-1]|uniref:Uncharacterized protein n=1 Tax=Aspergillus saccharolyticus JOP 1030-1 TaxID=1450539 RepID=A0A318ZHD6_9EURO|nr:hypothetical protein BP01DRAFT_318436 [Aspergillus saccharolyticus JOP 1030-1]PYH45784.1 hypothetical protein BP01DRAFT_318436 [Aspergillus saccharolyticus JOP 1030-1]